MIVSAVNHDLGLVVGINARAECDDADKCPSHSTFWHKGERRSISSPVKTRWESRLYRARL